MQSLADIRKENEEIARLVKDIAEIMESISSIEREHFGESIDYRLATAEAAIHAENRG